MRYGAKINVMDKDTRVPLQNVCRYQDLTKKFTQRNEVLLWGSNKNFNLGIGSEEDPTTPKQIDYFRKKWETLSIEKVALSGFHTLFLDDHSKVYAAGNGSRGSLGSGSTETLATPRKVRLSFKDPEEKIIDISASRKHSLVLTNKSIVYVCGINDFKQLGLPDLTKDEIVKTFKKINALQHLSPNNLIRVIAKDCYSLTYSNDQVFVWGANFGQFGHHNGEKKLDFVDQPEKLSFTSRDSINFIEANNVAIAIYTDDKIVHLCYKYKMKIIKTPDFEELKNICVTGGDLYHGSISALKLLMLTKTNVIYLWYEKTQMFYRTFFSHIRITEIDNILLFQKQLLILSNGDVYTGKTEQIEINQHKDNVTSKRRNPNIWSKCDQTGVQVSNEYAIRIDLERLPIADRVEDIYADDEFDSFGVIQESTYKYLSLPYLHHPILLQEVCDSTYLNLLKNATEDDMIHDIVFIIDDEKYPAHKFFIYLRSPVLKRIVEEANDVQRIHLKYKQLNGKLFYMVLEYIYAHKLPSTTDLCEIARRYGTEYGDKSSSFFNQLFYKFLDEFEIDTGEDGGEYRCTPVIYKSNPDKSRLKHSHLPELYDLKIICADNVEIPCHKCVLVANMDYFAVMFSHSWTEQRNVVKLTEISADYMRQIVKFLYNQDAEMLLKQNFHETYLYNMIMLCDQFFIEKLSIVFEMLLMKKISIRKCGEFLDFAHVYNRRDLRNGCLRFISANLGRVLAARSLEICSSDALKLINTNYRMVFAKIFEYRVITPNMEAISDEELLSFIDDGVHIDLNTCLIDMESDDKKSSPKTAQFKENTSSMRQFELDAISTMMETLNTENELNNLKKKEEKLKKTFEETEKIAENLRAEASSWTKVVDKKDQKKRFSVENAVKANGKLKQQQQEQEETKSIIEFLPLKSPLTKLSVTTATITSTATVTTIASTPSPTQNLKLVDSNEGRKRLASSGNQTPTESYSLSLTIGAAKEKQQKLSQKQRKRLFSTPSNGQTSTVTSACTSLNASHSTESLEIPQLYNAWGTIDVTQGAAALPESFYDLASSSPTDTATGSANVWPNFARVTRSSAKSTTTTDSFSKILADERRKRESYDRINNKSFELTQIEDTAIAELKKFYNVENITEEVITIERKPTPIGMNFATWQRN